MKTLSLSGNWKLKSPGKGESIEGKLPGYSYMDMKKTAELKRPFSKEGQEGLRELANQDWLYERSFRVKESGETDEVVLVIEGLSGPAEISLNGKLMGRAYNTYRSWRRDIKGHLKKGDNHLSILFKNPKSAMDWKELRNIEAEKSDKSPAEAPADTDKKAESKTEEAVKVAAPAAEEAAAAVPLKSTAEEPNAIQANIVPFQIRGPKFIGGFDSDIAPVGIGGDIYLELREKVALSDVRIRQEQVFDCVVLTIEAELRRIGSYNGRPALKAVVTGPNGDKLETELKGDGHSYMARMAVQNPQLWWCNGLGDQPMYEVRLELKDTELMDVWSRSIGLRSIKLGVGSNKSGTDFCFHINGLPIFARGANWLPGSSLAADSKALEQCIKAASTANMNMLRIWGGGGYESDEFYDLCDKYGILVWQDIPFEGTEYPLESPAFLENIKAELTENVQRLRHHPSLALWCGNSGLKPPKQKTEQLEQEKFFHKTLKYWLREQDIQNPYWAGAPKKAVKNYDQSAWHCWQLMWPAENFKKTMPSFCAEFGLESLPDIKTLETEHLHEVKEGFDPSEISHQSGKEGREKLKYHLLSKFRKPVALEDYVYLSQLCQAEAVGMATEAWRCQMESCHGALFWQLNDLRPGASFSSIDSGGRYKALQYRARHFNSSQLVSADIQPDYAELYLINDRSETFDGCIEWQLQNFDGGDISGDEIPARAPGNSARLVTRLSYSDILKGYRKTAAVLRLSLKSSAAEIIYSCSRLLVPEKLAELKKPEYTLKLCQEKDVAKLTLEADSFARAVQLQSALIETPFSDNFFDVFPGERRELEFELPKGKDIKELEKSIKIKSVADVEYGSSLLDDRMELAKLLLNKQGIMAVLGIRKRGIMAERPDIFPEES